MAVSARSRRRLSSLTHHVRVARLRSVFRGIQRRSRCRSCRDTSVLTGAFSYRMVALTPGFPRSGFAAWQWTSLRVGLRPISPFQPTLGVLLAPLVRLVSSKRYVLPTSHVSGSRATANQRRACRTGARASGLSFLLTTSHVERQ